MSSQGDVRPLAGSEKPRVGESGRIPGVYSNSSTKATFFFLLMGELPDEVADGVGEDILVDLD